MLFGGSGIPSLTPLLWLWGPHTGRLIMGYHMPSRTPPVQALSLAGDSVMPNSTPSLLHVTQAQPSQPVRQATQDSACPGSVPKPSAPVRTYLRPGSGLLGAVGSSTHRCVAEEGTHWGFRVSTQSQPGTATSCKGAQQRSHTLCRCSE